MLDGAFADLQAARDCWTVAFGHACSDEDRCLVAGYDNGDVKLYDLRKQSMVWETNVKNGVTGLEFDRNDIDMNKVYYQVTFSRMETLNQWLYWYYLVQSISCPGWWEWQLQK